MPRESLSRAALFGTTAVALAMVLGVSAWIAAARPAHDGDEAEHQEVGAAAGPRRGPALSEAVAMPDRLIGLELTFTRGAAAAEDWAGSIALSEGRLLGLEAVRGGGSARVEGATFAVDVSPAAEVPAKNAGKKKQNQAKKKAQANLPPTTLLANLDAPPTATVTLKTNRGEVALKLADLAVAKSVPLFGGSLEVARQAASVRLTPSDTEDDFPALAVGPDGAAWMASASYTPERARLAEPVEPKDYDRLLVPSRNGDRILLRKYDGASWSAAEEVAGPRIDAWRPAVAVDGGGRVHVAWAQQVNNNWDIYRRIYTPGKAGAPASWSESSRLTDDPGSDFHVVAATDAKGGVWLAWQAYRAGRLYEVLALPPGEAAPRVVSDSPANDWAPAIAADGAGRVYVAWDTYDRGNYDVRLRELTGGGPAEAVADSPRYEARPSLACDAAGRAWVAYEQGDVNWGKDYANEGPERVPVVQTGWSLYSHRTVRVVCKADGRWKEPEAAAEAALKAALNRNLSLPRLATDRGRNLWLAVRHHPLAGGAGEAWTESVLRFDGRAWGGPRVLPHAANLLDNRPALAPVEAGLMAVYSGDARTATNNRDQDDLFATIVPPEGTAAEAPALVDRRPAPEPDQPPAHANESADKSRIRDYRVDHGGRSLRLLRGEFHRHTEFTSHRDQDGLLEDAWRYALDAGDLDWMGDGDHMNGGGFEYMWWIVQKMTDLHHNPATFVPVHSYERSIVYPSGHRNVIMPRRGIRPLPIAAGVFGTEEGGSPDVKNLYAYLKHFGGICAVHTSGTNMGTDWRDNDPEVEPIVEIYQGHRHNYEHFGAPRSPTEATQIGGYEPKGFIWNALEKGYRLGFQSSSDHVSTHWSFAVVLTDDPSRRGIIDAFKKRHSYAATDNIVMDVRSGDGAHLMGDAFIAKGKPTLKVTALGTSPIARLHVIRDNKYALSVEPNRDRVDLIYTDDAARPGETHYYYVRVEQADANLAWASPMWITVAD